MNRELVRKELKKRGLRHGWIAERIGVQPSTFSAFLTGKRNLGSSALKLLMQELELNEEALSTRAS